MAFWAMQLNIQFHNRTFVFCSFYNKGYISSGEGAEFRMCTYLGDESEFRTP